MCAVVQKTQNQAVNAFVQMRTLAATTRVQVGQIPPVDQEVLAEAVQISGLIGQVGLLATPPAEQELSQDQDPAQTPAETHAEVNLKPKHATRGLAL